MEDWINFLPFACPLTSSNSLSVMQHNSELCLKPDNRLHNGYCQTKNMAKQQTSKNNCLQLLKCRTVPVDQTLHPWLPTSLLVVPVVPTSLLCGEYIFLGRMILSKFWGWRLHSPPPRSMTQPPGCGHAETSIILPILPVEILLPQQTKHNSGIERKSTSSWCCRSVVRTVSKHGGDP